MSNSISCIIVDDEQDAIELLIDRVNKLFKNITIIDTFSHWTDALAALQQQQPDLLFMDISMPGKNSIELLKLLPGLDSEIIFVTAHEQYAIDAFSFSTSGYILKPVDDAELSTAINKAIERIHIKRMARQKTAPAAGAAPAAKEKIGIANNHGIDYIVIDDILYMESTNKCTRIVTDKTEYTSSTHLGRFKHLIDQHHFFQVHRSFIVNLDKILRYESSGMIIMANKDEVPLSRSVKNDFLNIFNSDF